MTEICKLDVIYELTNERLNSFYQFRTKLTTALLLLFPDCKLTFKLYVDASMTGPGVALHYTQVVHDILTEGPNVFMSRQLKDSEGRYGASQLECLCLVWALEKLHYYSVGSVCEVITDFTALKSLFNKKKT